MQIILILQTLPRTSIWQMRIVQRWEGIDFKKVGQEENRHLPGAGNGQGAEQIQVIDRKCCCTKWLTAERCRTRVSYSTLCQFQCCPRLSVVSVRHCAVSHCVVNPELRMENVSVGRGCFELWHGECSVSVNLPLTAGQTVQSCVHTQIRNGASTLLAEHIMATQIQWTAIEAWLWHIPQM